MGKKSSVDVVELYKWLIDVAVGSVVTYADLSALIGRDVSGRYRYILRAARDMAEKENKIVFDVVKNVGLRRSSDEEIVDIGSDGLVRVIRLAKRRARTTLCADYESLSNQKKIKHNVTLSTLGAMIQSASPKALVEKERAMAQGCQMPPENELLAQFS